MDYENVSKQRFLKSKTQKSFKPRKETTQQEYQQKPSVAINQEEQLQYGRDYKQNEALASKEKQRHSHKTNIQIHWNTKNTTQELGTQSRSPRARLKTLNHTPLVQKDHFRHIRRPKNTSMKPQNTILPQRKFHRKKKNEYLENEKQLRILQRSWT